MNRRAVRRLLAAVVVGCGGAATITAHSTGVGLIGFAITFLGAALLVED